MTHAALPTRAAEYVRMSTDLQSHSIAYQRQAIADYAVARGIEVVRTFSDAGKSGLRLEGRAALQALIIEVQSGQADFEVLLVFDVSRWGRFQDTDESAHYEYICRRNGVRVIYCAEPFENDGGPMSTIYKGIKRAMAAEYSRDLSHKISTAKTHLATLGYFPGGAAGFGLRRLLTDERGRPKQILEHGEHKNIQSDRVVHTLGPPHEIALVRRIYDLFLDDRLSYREISGLLNFEGHRTERGNLFTVHLIRSILTEEKYIGNIVVNRTRQRLGKRSVAQPRDQWVRVVGAFDAIISPDRFARVQSINAARIRTDEMMLSGLRALYVREGRLSSDLIRKANLPGTNSYMQRFGSLLAAYKRVGYTPPGYRTRGIALRLHDRVKRTSQCGEAVVSRQRGRRLSTHPRRIDGTQSTIDDWYVSDEAMLSGLKRLLDKEGRLSTELIEKCAEIPSVSSYRHRFGGLVTAYGKVGYELPAWRAAGFASRMLRRARERDPNEASADLSEKQVRLEDNKRSAIERYLVSEADMIDRLRTLYAQQGALSQKIIDASPDTPSTHACIERFGSLFAVYHLVGFEPTSPYARGMFRRYRQRAAERAVVSTPTTDGPDQLSDGSENDGKPKQGQGIDGEHQTIMPQGAPVVAGGYVAKRLSPHGFRHTPPDVDEGSPQANAANPY